jgi:hypothetical protein
MESALAAATGVCVFAAIRWPSHRIRLRLGGASRDSPWTSNHAQDEAQFLTWTEDPLI